MRGLPICFYLRGLFQFQPHIPAAPQATAGIVNNHWRRCRWSIPLLQAPTPYGQRAAHRVENVHSADDTSWDFAHINTGLHTGATSTRRAPLFPLGDSAHPPSTRPRASAAPLGHATVCHAPAPMRCSQSACYAEIFIFS